MLSSSGHLADPLIHPVAAGKAEPKGPFAGETKTDSWLLAHFKSLRNHFKHNGLYRSEVKSKHDMLQECGYEQENLQLQDNNKNQVPAPNVAMGIGAQRNVFLEKTGNASVTDLLIE